MLVIVEVQRLFLCSVVMFAIEFISEVVLVIRLPLAGGARHDKYPFVSVARKRKPLPPKVEIECLS